MKKVLVICGATATGKTALAANCALTLGSEVISADSQLIYRGLNIGTAKPTEEEKLGVPHRMIDVVNPKEKYSVSDYKTAAMAHMERLINGGKIPVICGGTGFYINSLLFDLGYGGTQGDDKVREKYARILEERGKEYLFSLLEKVDEPSSKTIHPNDTKRVIRALEIYELSGKRKSDQCDELNPVCDYLAVAIDYPRDELYLRIDKRVDEMFDRGLVEEVKGLLSEGVDENCQSMQAIGYKEVLEGLKNGYSQSTMRDIIKKNTRHYAKRQITFFKKLPSLVWIKPDCANTVYVLELLND